MLNFPPEFQQLLVERLEELAGSEALKGLEDLEGLEDMDPFQLQ